MCIETNQLDVFSFFLGIISSIIIPLVSFIYKKIKLDLELKKIEKMIITEYVKPIENKLNNFPSTKTDIEKMIGDKAKRLTYLNEHEIKYMNFDNQFSIIRMIEYTKMYYKQIDKILNKQYDFIDTTENPISQISELTELIDLTKKYKKTLNQYIKLKRDYLIDSTSEL